MLKNKEKISLIIPVYNVEKYLKKCIDSIISQTYKNLEVILIDDGSTDNSGKICDEYLKKDDRIKVFHKLNGGVSSARNLGIEKSDGDYIIFVDADDYLENDFVYYMLSIAEKTKSDFCLSKNCYKSINDEQIKNDIIETYSPAKATALLLSMEMDVGCWNKIYKRKMLLDNKIKFNENQYYGEGLIFITDCSQKSNSVGVGIKRKYYYRQNNMKSATKKFNFRKFVNGEQSLNIIEEKLKIFDKNVEMELNIHYCMFYFNAILELYMYNKIKENLNYYKDFKCKYKKYLKKVIFYKKINFKQKIKLVMLLFFPNTVAKMIKNKRNSNAKKSV